MDDLILKSCSGKHGELYEVYVKIHPQAFIALAGKKKKRKLVDLTFMYEGK